MLKKIITLAVTSFAFINSLNAETIYSPAVTVTGGGEEGDSLSGSGTYIGSDTIKSNNYDNIDQVLKTIPGVYSREENGYGIFPNISLRGVDPGRSQKLTIMEDGVLSQPAPYTDSSAYFNPTNIIVGYDHHFGFNREGNADICENSLSNGITQT